MPPDVITELAPAKINLALHVTGQRGDGYHLMQSVVAFARHGDRLSLSLAASDGFSLSGRFAAALGPVDDQQHNLVLKARDVLRRALVAAGRPAPPVAIHLEKNLPVAAGIGGGSADAAATLSGLLRLWQADIEPAVLRAIAVALGADVPMCLARLPLLARGIGDEIEPLPGFPSFAVVLANPLVGVSTPAIFRLLDNKANPPLPVETGAAGHGEWLQRLALCRNDLEPPARGLLPEIGMLSAMLAAEGARLVRMSGSGATCFGVFDDRAGAEKAAAALHARRPDWYFQATETASGEAAWHA